jgi:molybdopterin molybdotransferase/putative molybdopterin biosynthesis protein
MMELISFQQSLKILQNRVEVLQSSEEKIPTRVAHGRVLTKVLHAKKSSPNIPRAAMDGIALDFYNAGDLPVKLNTEQWIRINTGEPVPSGFNAVVKIEDIRWEDDQPVLEKPVSFMQNVRRAGEDFHAGALLLQSGHRLEPQDLSLLLTAGFEEIEVAKRPIVTFIPTGSELVAQQSEMKSENVMESNSAMIAGLVESWGGEFRITSAVEDEDDALLKMIRSNLAESDILLISAGTSMGTGDRTGNALHQLGKIYFHGVALHPAKPVILAEIGNVPVIGLPGYPAAAYVAAYLFLRPLVCKLSRVEQRIRQEVLISSEDIPSRSTDSFYRVHCFDVNGRIYVRRIPGGASSILTLSRMDGLMHVPADTPIRKRDAVRVDLFRDITPNSLVIRGASDPVVLRLFDIFHEQNPTDRILFWETSTEEALENIVERNSHLAIIATQQDGEDAFPEFADRLQENMLRHRIFTRSVNRGATFHAAAEHLDLVVPEEYLEFPPVKKLLRLLISDQFAAQIKSFKEL